MRNTKLYTVDAILRILFVTIALITNHPVSARSPELQARVQRIMQAATKNNRCLANLPCLNR